MCWPVRALPLLGIVMCIGARAANASPPLIDISVAQLDNAATIPSENTEPPRQRRHTPRASQVIGADCATNTRTSTSPSAEWRSWISRASGGGLDTEAFPYARWSISMFCTTLMGINILFFTSIFNTTTNRRTTMPLSGDIQGFDSLDAPRFIAGGSALVSDGMPLSVGSNRRQFEKLEKNRCECGGGRCPRGCAERILADRARHGIFTQRRGLCADDFSDGHLSRFRAGRGTFSWETRRCMAGRELFTAMAHQTFLDLAGPSRIRGAAPTADCLRLPSSAAGRNSVAAWPRTMPWAAGIPTGAFPGLINRSGESAQRGGYVFMWIRGCIRKNGPGGRECATLVRFSMAGTSLIRAPVR